MKLKIMETSGKSKAKNLFAHPEKSKRIKTFAIFTAENRDKRSDYDSDENRLLNRNLKVDLAYDKDTQKARLSKDKTDKALSKLASKGIPVDSFEKNIRSGHYHYYKVKGKYGNVEHSFIVYNITVDDAKKLCEKYGQQAFIFGYNDNGSLKFEMWSNRSKSGYSFYKIDEKDTFNVLDSDAEDFYTQISRDYKINIPFEVFEFAPEEMIESIDRVKNERGYSDSAVMHFIDESLDSSISAKYRYFAKATLNHYFSK